MVESLDDRIAHALDNGDKKQVDAIFDEPGGYEALLRVNANRKTNKKKVEPLETVEQVATISGQNNPLHLTDTGNAELLVAKFQGDLHYCYSWGKWLIWDGRRWKEDTNGEIMRRAKLAVKDIYTMSDSATILEDKKKLLLHALKSESTYSLKALVENAESIVPIEHDDLNKDKFQLNCLNGTLDLTTRQRRPHKREDHITKIVNVNYNPKAKCPRWLEFLDLVFNGNKAVIRFMKRSAGYTLTGSVGEKAMFILYGLGNNGKSTFVNVILRILGEYATYTSSDTLMAKRSDDKRNDLAMLQGMRFVPAMEGQEGAHLNEAIIKAITGGDPVTCRFLRQEFFSYYPEYKLWYSTNHKPIIRGTDPAIWNRIMLIPFEVDIPATLMASGKPLIKNYENVLLEEAEGILAWMVEGCLEWISEGLMPPQEVMDARAEYKYEMDDLGRWLKEDCVEEKDSWELFKFLYKAYTTWCDENGVKPLGTRTFGMRLEERGMKGQSGTDNVAIRVGIRLTDKAKDRAVRNLLLNAN